MITFPFPTYTRYYFGNGQYEKTVQGSTIKTILYLDGSPYEANVALETNAGVTRLLFISRDHLSSITHITDANKILQAEYSYDAWGRMRNPATLVVYNPGAEPALLLNRGYTGHEHLREFGLINMNARLYDPLMGRMISPDNYVSNSMYTDAFNRYTYANNNPLYFTDPDGNFVWAALIPIAIAAVKGAVIASAVYIASNFVQGGTWKDLNFRDWGVSAAMGAAGGAVGGAFSLLGSSIGSFGQSVTYGLMTNVATQVAVDAAFGNDITFGSVAGAAVGGLIDGAIPQFKGISFKKYNFGALMANVGAEMTINTGRGAVIGGISSSIGGGSFWRGARSGAVGGFVRTGINIAILGATIRPTGAVKAALDKMGENLNINATGAYGPTYRTGALWNRGLFVGRTAEIYDKYGGGGVSDVGTWVHETYHYYQQLTQGWARQFSKGLIEQWFLDPAGNFIYNYRTYGTKYNESAADYYEEVVFPRLK
ncbi:MAG: RHS repeat-associated core domain-containing protein [Agriterribacter sp.]